MTDLCSEVMSSHRTFCETPSETSSEFSGSFAFAVCTCAPHAVYWPQIEQVNGRLNYLMVIRLSQSPGKDELTMQEYLWASLRTGFQGEESFDKILSEWKVIFFNLWLLQFLQPHLWRNLGPLLAWEIPRKAGRQLAFSSVYSSSGLINRNFGP